MKQKELRVSVGRQGNISMIKLLLDSFSVLAEGESQTIREHTIICSFRSLHLIGFFEWLGDIYSLRLDSPP
jgi:hypothetical protein